NPARKVLNRIESCTNIALNDHQGPIISKPQRPGIGFEFLNDGKRLTGAFHEYVPFKYARYSCRQTRLTYPKGECRFNGNVFEPDPVPPPSDLAGAWCDPQMRVCGTIAQSGGSLTLNLPGLQDNAKASFSTNDLDVSDLVRAANGESALIGPDA